VIMDFHISLRRYQALCCRPTNTAFTIKTSSESAPDLQTQVLIIGAGVTGTGLARDLSMRGAACIVLDKGDVNSGASGGNHGLLHSGARYVATDPHVARECRDEALILRGRAPHCIEDTGGLFVAVEGDDEKYVADFPGMCRRQGIAAKEVDVGEVRDLEPEVSERLIAAYHVNDASIDPFRLSWETWSTHSNSGRGS
jgi:glycerol-3-phosphate dehydrogenase